MAENSRHGISIFSPSGEKIRTFGCMGSAQGQFNGPCGVDDDGDILVVDGKKQQNIAFRSPHGMESSLLQ